MVGRGERQSGTLVSTETKMSSKTNERLKIFIKILFNFHNIVLIN